MYKHGLYTCNAVEERRNLASLLRAARRQANLISK
jgi:hypothetical protein